MKDSQNLKGDNINLNKIQEGNAQILLPFPVKLINKISKDDENQIIACHRLDKTDQTIVKFLSCKDAEAVFKKKKKKKRMLVHQSFFQKILLPVQEV